MKRTILLLLIIAPLVSLAQPNLKNKKYQGLLWEISGNGLNKPSYLFGTMHVSSKLAFHLADSFYLSIRNADVVALETNPESWQEDMSKYDMGGSRGYLGYASMESEPRDYFRINALKFFKYNKKIERALYSNPSTINNLLYRSYGNESSDFEEDTYLDMYIYQCGKKWGKKVAGVERYGESMKLMAEAYRDAARDKSRRDRSYDVEDGYGANKLQEAYRSGNLDWLDSINRYNSFSAAFDEKFLYRRNEIQAASIDSILRSGQSLFVGVGAAHLPGQRGVIEMLRQMGYKLRPVKMGARDSQHKNQVEKLRVPVVFATQSAADGFYKVDIPGKFYRFGEDAALDQWQYADMANGSYYMVTRIMTNAWMWNHNPARVEKVIDSLLYENIPGRILQKTTVVKNGYKGIDITNRTRRGDVQRYQIYTTPFEIIVFKMSGTAEYVSLGDEAKKFFGSIQMKEYRPAVGGWMKYSPPAGGFAVNFPHDPYVGNDGSWIFDAQDISTQTHYRVIRTDIHNFHFAEEDTFDLSLMEESFAASEFIDKQISRQHHTWKGYPALDTRYRDKDGRIYLVRFLIQGPHYYTVIAHGKKDEPAMKDFLRSFEITPLRYRPAKEERDTSLYFRVKTPVYESNEKEKLDISPNLYASGGDDDFELDELEVGTYRTRLVANDTTGEKIFVAFFKTPRYYYLPDSSSLDKESQGTMFSDSTWITKLRKKYDLPNGMRVWENIITDTGCSRTLWTKTFFKDGMGFLLANQGDTLTPPSVFVQTFYDSFTPADTLKGANIFVKKTDLFFDDFMSTDSAVHKRAIKGLNMVEFDSTDLPRLRQAISSLGWHEPNYLDIKKRMIGKLDAMQSVQSADYLRDLYYAAGDTIELQYTVLEELLQQKTDYAYRAFMKIMASEPPVLNLTGTSSTVAPPYIDYSNSTYGGYDDGSFLDEMNDSLQLASAVVPDLLFLLNLDDYKFPMMNLLAEMVDSNLLKPADYKDYYDRFLLEAKQEVKKQLIMEKQKAIKKEEELRSERKNSYMGMNRNDSDEGNERITLYATLLQPFWDSNPAVKNLFNQLLSSSADRELKYEIMSLLLRNGRPCPDSLLTFFAKSDDYRYRLYSDLREIGLGNRFPAMFNSHLDLAKSKLLSAENYSRPDSLVFADRIEVETQGKKGYMYFFKYKAKKDDAGWKIASVGLVPRDAKQFEFDDVNDESYRFNFTSFSPTRVDDEKPIMEQLHKATKRLLYSRRKSARNFYSGEERPAVVDYTIGDD